METSHAANGLESARSDDAADRVARFERHRRRLFGLAYRMLGSAVDAEDLVQEAFIRWYSADQHAIRSDGAWLSTVVTRLCLDQLKSGHATRERSFPELPELVSDSTDPGDAALAETLSVAFLVLLQKLDPRARAVFLLREVFDYDHADVARILGTTAANCRQILRRARRHVHDERRRFDATPDEVVQLTARFLDASRTGNLEALEALLAEDVILVAEGGPKGAAYGRARAIDRPLTGAVTVARVLVAAKRQAPADLRHAVKEINNRAAIVVSRNDTVIAVMNLAVGQGNIHAIYVYTNPDKHRQRQAL